MLRYRMVTLHSPKDVPNPSVAIMVTIGLHDERFAVGRGHRKYVAPLETGVGHCRTRRTTYVDGSLLRLAVIFRVSECPVSYKRKPSPLPRFSDVATLRKKATANSLHCSDTACELPRSFLSTE